MPVTSPFAPLRIPETDLLTYLFPPGQHVSDKPLWIDATNPHHSLSPNQMLQWIKRLAVGLDKIGCARGQVVLIYTPNHIFVPAAYMAIVGSGRIFSGANPAYTEPELLHQLRDTGAQVLLAHPSLASTAVSAGQKAGLATNRIFLFSDVEHDPLHAVRDWREMIGSSDEAELYQWKRMTGAEPKNTVATVNYSSGTTGLPKGVCISHYSLIANAEQAIYMRYAFKKRTPERWAGFLPLYHAYGQLYANILALKLQATIYIMKQFAYDHFLRVIETYKINSLQVAPPILVMMSKRPETARYDLSCLEEITCGAAPLSKELADDIVRRFRVSLKQGYGMTELTCAAIVMPGGAEELKDNTGSVGQLCPNTECILRDDDGNEVLPGKPGEMYIRGPQVCLGYWRNDQASKETLSSDGWLRTGDIAMERGGWFWIVDRKKELIKVNGLQVAPAELEAVLLEHKDIADAAVVGITLRGEEWPRAYVTLKGNKKDKTTEKQIQDWMKGKVAKHKRLIGGISFIDEVPKLQSGKIMRKILKQWASRDAMTFGASVAAKL
ncbi:4-coumarate-ligase [Lasiodiplodia theobromae]|uniref:Putative acyl-coenzyme A synthetase n=1 Tax=Lasiodiplodia theobromae TaxID=45133 RepID=A0A5N5D9T9_9PEZI|nr:4-coumarate-ligase [Lasiodiplodia theobromae]KAB2574593.1 putative acyl-coenzyme A synthetase [Lasiodiplodia theobromae]KAF4537898.1 4-coumarate-ligase [Lasiodiplodia theobromae]